MKERLLQLLEMEQLSSSKLADLIGVQRSSISHILSGRNKPSFDFLNKTLETFPGLNAAWLIQGKGPMYEQMGRTEEVVSAKDPQIEMDLGQKDGAKGPEVLETESGSEKTGIAREHKNQSGSESLSDPVPQEQARISKSPENPVVSAVQNTVTLAAQAEKPKLSRIIMLYEDGSYDSFTPEKSS